MLNIMMRTVLSIVMLFILPLIFASVTHAQSYGQPCGPNGECSQGECETGINICTHCGYAGERVCIGTEGHRPCAFSDTIPISGVCRVKTNKCGQRGYRACDQRDDPAYDKPTCYSGLPWRLGTGDWVCVKCGDYYQPCCTYTDFPCDYGSCAKPRDPSVAPTLVRYPYTGGFCRPMAMPSMPPKPAKIYEESPKHPYPGPKTYADCGPVRDVYFARCNEIRDRAAKLNCEKNRYSGCALDVVGCFTPYLPNHVFTDQACAQSGYLGCAKGAYEGYLGCLDSCNSAFREARRNLRTCLNECQARIKSALDACKK